MLPWLLPIAAASPWIEEAGHARIGLAAWRLSSRQQFAGGEARGLTGPRCPDPIDAGQRMPYSCVTGGAYRVVAATADAAIGIAPHVALDLLLPMVSARFADDVGSTSTTGLGDVSGGVRVGSAGSTAAWSAALHVQAPSGPGGFQDRDVPLGTGQWDVVPGVRIGASRPGLGWVEVWQALAIRLRSAQTGINPGDEWRPTVVAGWTPREWGGLGMRLEGVLAVPDTDGFGLRHPGRSLLQCRPSAFLRPSARGWVELGIALPVAGRRWPAAATPYLSAAWRVGGKPAGHRAPAAEVRDGDLDDPVGADGIPLLDLGSRLGQPLGRHAGQIGG